MGGMTRDEITRIHGHFVDNYVRTCNDLGGEDGTNFENYDFGCSECGFACDLPEPNYCPNRGAKAVSDDAA